MVEKEQLRLGNTNKRP